MVDEVGADGILAGAVPGGEDLLAEVEAPGRVALVRAPLLHQLLALRDGIQDVVPAPAQRPHLPQRDTSSTAMPALGLPQGQQTQCSQSPNSKKSSRKVSRGMRELYVVSGCIFTSQLCGKGNLTGLQQ